MLSSEAAKQTEVSRSAGGDGSRWTWSSQFFMSMSDPQWGAVTLMESRPTTEWLSFSIWATTKRKKKKQKRQPGQWLLVLNWILTGSNRQGSCKVTRGCDVVSVCSLSSYLTGSIHFYASVHWCYLWQTQTRVQGNIWRKNFFF